MTRTEHFDVYRAGAAAFEKVPVDASSKLPDVLNTRWRGRDYLFAMNGQTGRFVGDLPMSWGKFRELFAAVAAPLAAIGVAMALWL